MTDNKLGHLSIGVGNSWPPESTKEKYNSQGEYSMNADELIFLDEFDKDFDRVAESVESLSDSELNSLVEVLGHRSLSADEFSMRVREYRAPNFSDSNFDINTPDRSALHANENISNNTDGRVHEFYRLLESDLKEIKDAVEIGNSRMASVSNDLNHKMDSISNYFKDALVAANSRMESVSKDFRYRDSAINEIELHNRKIISRIEEKISSLESQLSQDKVHVPIVKQMSEKRSIDLQSYVRTFLRFFRAATHPIIFLEYIISRDFIQAIGSVKSIEDIEDKLNMKLLGLMPQIRVGIMRQIQELPMDPSKLSDENGIFLEAVNTVRTAISMADRSKKGKVIMITSSVPNEGKSTASLYLSYSFSQLENVLLIDCDMRRPSLAKAAGLDNNVQGLSSLINASASAKDCIIQGAFGGALDILPTGPIPDLPLELLASPRFKKILEQLRGRYDRIVIDSAPIQAVSDALVLSCLCDAVVYVIKSHDTNLNIVKRGTRRLESVNAPVIGALLTQVDIDRITSFGADYYYQGYYDYYGYQDKTDVKSMKSEPVRLTKAEIDKLKDVDFDCFSSDLGGAKEVKSDTAAVGNRLTSKLDTVSQGSSLKTE